MAKNIHVHLHTKDGVEIDSIRSSLHAISSYASQVDSAAQNSDWTKVEGVLKAMRSQIDGIQRLVDRIKQHGR